MSSSPGGWRPSLLLVRRLGGPDRTFEHAHDSPVGHRQYLLVGLVGALAAAAGVQEHGAHHESERLQRLEREFHEAVTGRRRYPVVEAIRALPGVHSPVAR